MNNFYKVFWFFAATCTAMVGHSIHGGWFWTICNFIFWPLSWVKWLVFHEVSLPVIKSTFTFFMGTT